jgi:hypothetical protein
MIRHSRTARSSSNGASPAMTGAGRRRRIRRGVIGNRSFKVGVDAVQAELLKQLIQQVRIFNR